MTTRTKSTATFISLALSLALGACAAPTVDEIREQAKGDFYALLRHTAKTLDRAENRKAVNDGLTQLNNLFAKATTIDIFDTLDFTKEVEKLIVDLDEGIPELFTDKKVVADITDGKRFRVTGRELCAILSGQKIATTTCNARHGKVNVDLDVTLDGGTVRISVSFDGQPIFASLTLSSDRALIDIDGEKTLAAINHYNQQTGQKLVDPRNFAGKWRVDWRKSGEGVTVESTLDNAILAQDTVVPDGQGGERNAIVDLRIKAAKLKASLISGEASVEGAVTPTSIDFPDNADNLRLESSPLEVKLSAAGDQQVEATISAAGTPSATMKFNGKVGISATIDRGGAGSWSLRTELRGKKTVLVLLNAVKPSFEIYPEIISDGEKPIKNPKVDGEFSKGLAVARAPATPAVDPIVEIVSGSAKLTSGAKTLELKGGNCLLDANPQQVDSLLDYLAQGACQ